MKDVKRVFFAICEEIADVLNLFIRNIWFLVCRFWRQSWNKKIIDIGIGLIFSLLPMIGMMVFNMSMQFNVDKLDILQNVVYHFLVQGICIFLFVNFAELFAILSLGGVAILNTKMYESINNRLKAYKQTEAKYAVL